MTFAVTHVRTVHSRALTAYNEMKQVRETWRDGPGKYRDKQLRWFLSYNPMGVFTEDQLMRGWYEWRDEDEEILAELLETVKRLDRFQRPNKRMT